MPSPKSAVPVVRLAYPHLPQYAIRGAGPINATDLTFRQACQAMSAAPMRAHSGAHITRQGWPDRPVAFWSAWHKHMRPMPAAADDERERLAEWVNEFRPLTRGELLAQIVDALYPGGDPDSEWSADTLETVSAILRAAGLTPSAPSEAA